jgi:hypothetical protein
MKAQHLKLLTALLLLSLLAVACGGGSGATPTPIVIVVTPPPPGQAQPTATAPEAPASAGGIEIVAATFAHGLSDQMEPVGAGSDFRPDETIYLSLQIKGRPKEGVITGRFYWRDSFIAEADVDLADVNSGLIFSVGESTYAGYTLTHEQPFPVSDGYRADVSTNGQALGSYPFRIVPPADAIPTVIGSVTLARGVDDSYNPVEPTTTFSAADQVYLVGHGDLGLDTWLQADWYINGQLDEAGTRSLTLDQNAPDVGFSFTYLPEGGWPAGEQSVLLTVNGQEIGRYTFTITP